MTWPRSRHSRLASAVLLALALAVVLGTPSIQWPYQVVSFVSEGASPRPRFQVQARCMLCISAVPRASAASTTSSDAGSAFRASSSPLVATAGSVKPEFPQQVTYTLTAESTAGDIVEAYVFYRPLAAAITQRARVEVTPGRRVELRHSVDMTRNYLPPGLDIRYYWSLTDSAGNRLDTEPQVFRYQDERFPWRTRQGGQVTVLFYAGNDDFAQDLLDTALRTIDKLGRSFGVKGSEPIHIVVYGSNRDFSTSLPPNSAEWIGGQAHPELGLIVTGIQPGSGAAREIRRVIPHEISHLVLHQATENPYGGPAHWLDEGLATYNQEVVDTSLEPLLDKAVKDGALVPVRALNSNFPLDPNEARLSYAESLSLVEYLIATYGEAKLGELLTSFRNELSYDEALTATLGIDTDQLDQQWKASLGYKGDRPRASRAGSDAPSSAAPLGRVGLPVAALGLIVTGGLVFRRRTWSVKRGA